MRWVAVIAVLSAFLLLTGCPEESCRGNEDCLNGYSCSGNGKCVKTDPLRIVTSNIPDGVVGEEYQFTVVATGGIEPYTWVVETNIEWLSMQASTGNLSGNPNTVIANAPLTVTVKDGSKGGGEEASRDFFLNVAYCSDSQASPCSGHGSCTAGVCECDVGYTGNQCESCDDGYHESQGECVADVACDLNSCSGHGECDDSGGVIDCTCYEGYSGESCSECAAGFHDNLGLCVKDEVCLANSCDEHGTCDDSSGVVVCNCETGYGGDYCESCANGYHREGENCFANENCEAGSCSGRGTCDDSFGVVVCTCDEGYDGEHCESCAGGYHDESGVCVKDQVCLPNSCSGHGTCEDVTGVVVCDCDEWYEGDFCESLAAFGLSQIDQQAGDNFGRSVSISGNYIVVGASGEDGGPGDPISEAGAAYVFRREVENSWAEGIKITPPNAYSNSMFGWSVGIDGDYLVVGALYDNGPGGSIIDAGAAYVFRRVGVNEWDEGTGIYAPDAQHTDRFGHSVSISGDYIVVGASGEDWGSGDPISEAGAVYVFRRTGVNNWDDVQKLVSPDAQSNDKFGMYVSISGEYLVVSSLYENGGPGDPISEAGAVYVFRRTGTNEWDEGTKLVSPNAQIEDHFGRSVSISGDYIVVGADSDDGVLGDPNPDSGAAYIFRRTGTNEWNDVTKVVSTDPSMISFFGYSVSISGSDVVVTTKSYNNGSGTAYLFSRTGMNTWSYVKNLYAPDAQSGDNFGNSVSFSDGYIVVGALYENGGDGDPAARAGAAYVFYP